jgi:hypothetical protein
LYQGRWKGIRSGGENAPIKLYDQKTDVAEKNDVAAQNPEIAETISKYLLTARTESANWTPVWKAK